MAKPNTNPTQPSLLRVLPDKVQCQRARGILGTEHHSQLELNL